MVSRLLIACALTTAGCDQLFGLDELPPPTDAGNPTLDAAVDDGAVGAGQLVFVSSVGKTGNMNGLAGADAFCQQLAIKAGVPGTYKAWLSSSSESPATRMIRAKGPYKLVNGTIIANDWTDLTDGTIRSPINIDELGQGALGAFICANGELWSNSDYRGDRAGTTCMDWTSESIGVTGEAARLTSTDASWTTPSCPSVSCGSYLSIYCFGQ